MEGLSQVSHYTYDSGEEAFFQDADLTEFMDQLNWFAKLQIQVLKTHPLQDEVQKKLTTLI